MMRIYSIFILACVTLLAPLSFAATADDHAGGGIFQNGKYMSFYSAGLYTEPQPVAANAMIPGLNNLVGFLNKFSYLSEETKLKWINLILPTSEHHYYRAQDDKFSPEIRDRLIEEYARLTKQPKADLRLFAITDTNSRVTFLLPDFYKLNSLDQMGILMHEALWLATPEADYAQIVNSEMAIEAVIDQPENIIRVSEALKFLGNRVDQILLAVRADSKSGALNGLISKGSINLKKLFGPRWLKCEVAGNDGDCFRYAVQELYANVTNHPNSLLLREMYASMTAGRLRIHEPENYEEYSQSAGYEVSYVVEWSACSLQLKVDQRAVRTISYGQLMGTCTMRSDNPVTIYSYGTPGPRQSTKTYLYQERNLFVSF